MYGGRDASIGGFNNYCRSGVTTGEQCGNTVIAQNGTICHPVGGCTGGLYVHVGTGVPSAGGDSGAPIYAVAADNAGAHMRAIHIGRIGRDMFAEAYSGVTTALGVTAVIEP